MTASAFIPTSPDPEPVHKSENKFYAFFRSRSRSRTRTKNNPTPSDHMSSDADPLPSTMPSSLRHHATTKDSLSSDNPPSSYAKSSMRSQTRPISSTTTATHSTITPLPSDSLRRRMNGTRHEFVSRPQSSDTHRSLRDHDRRSDNYEYDSDDHRPPRSETPSSTKRKLALHTFFGISLSRKPSSSGSTRHPSSERKGSTSTSASESKSKNTRRPSFRLTSRPGTPKSTEDSSTSKTHFPIPIPSSPLPLSASPRRRSFGLGITSQRSTPKSSTGHLPLPPVQSGQIGRSHGRRHSVGSERPPHDSAVALPEVHGDGSVAHRGSNKGGHIPLDVGRQNKGKDREQLYGDSEPRQARPSTDSVSQSLPSDPSPLSRINLLPMGHTRTRGSGLPTVESVSSDENDVPSLLAPRPIPVIPQIIHTPPTPQRPGEIDSVSRPTPPKVDSGKVKIAKVKAASATHREQVLVSSSQSHTDASTPSARGRFASRLISGKDQPKIKDIGGERSGKRAAAGSADGHTHKIHASMTSHRAQLGSFDFERPVSALNRSSSTVDRTGLHVPPGTPSNSKARLHSLERTVSGESTRGGRSRLVNHHAAGTESPMLSKLQPDHTGDTSVASFSTVSIQTKSTGKGVGTNTTAGQSSSWGRASGRRVLRTSHGTFAFESPASVPNSPNPHTFNLPGSSNRDVSEPTQGHPRSQPTSPLYAVFDTRAKHSRGQSYNTSDHADPGYSKLGERRPKGKGRSLDLGLGLSWAPSRVREEVLMPGFLLTREKAKKGNADGSDVTKVFESLLSESGFQTFKKYVHRFDAHTIPLEGPTGLLARVEKLLAESGLSQRERTKLMSEFAIFVEGHSG